MLINAFCLAKFRLQKKRSLSKNSLWLGGFSCGFELIYRAPPSFKTNASWLRKIWPCKLPFLMLWFRHLMQLSITRELTSIDLSFNASKIGSLGILSLSSVGNFAHVTFPRNPSPCGRHFTWAWSVTQPNSSPWSSALFTPSPSPSWQNPDDETLSPVTCGNVSLPHKVFLLFLTSGARVLTEQDTRSALHQPNFAWCWGEHPWGTYATTLVFDKSSSQGPWAVLSLWCLHDGCYSAYSFRSA